MADRYFVEYPIDSHRSVLTGAEAHHLAHVLRARSGDVVAVFDGSGAEFLARVERVGRSEIELAILSRQEISRELPSPLTLAVALPKGDRQRWLVEKAVELGVTRLIPLETARSVAQPAAATLVRLRRAVIEACKQCGRNRLLEITEPRSWAELAAEPIAPGERRAIADPRSQQPAGAWIDSFRAEPPPGVLVAIGPEGGFTSDEFAQACAAGWQSVQLGSAF